MIKENSNETNQNNDKNRNIAAMTALLLPYGALASASEAPSPLSSTIQAETGKWEKTDEITSENGQVYKYTDPTNIGDDVYYYYVNYDNLMQEKGNKGLISNHGELLQLLKPMKIKDIGLIKIMHFG